MTDSSTSAQETTDSSDPGPSGESLTSGTIGTHHISALVVAAAAPIAGVVGLVPLAVLLGNGVGTPGAIFGVALVLLLFSVGFVRVVPHIRNTGAFYAYISNGLGKPAGLASAYVSAVAYLALAASTIGGLSYYASDLTRRFFHASVPWWICGLIAIAVVSVLAWIGITLAARLLLAVLSLEVVAIGGLDLAVVVHRGFGAFSIDAVSPSHVFSGSVGIAAVYAFSCFLGFEGTAIYSEEARQPLRTIPRATYSVVAIVGLFYGFSAWAVLAGAGFGGAVARDAEDPGNFVFGLSDQYVSTLWSDGLSVLVVTSMFAGLLSFQNAGARYLFALSRDGVLPQVLARTDAKRGTPAPAIVLFGGAVAAVLGAFALGGLDPLLQLATSMAGLGTVGLIALLTVASVSIAVFFTRRGDRRPTVTVVPLLAAVLLAACTVAGLMNYDALTGSTSPVINDLAWIYVPVVAAGFAFALYVRTRRPAQYAVLGTTRVD